MKIGLTAQLLKGKGADAYQQEHEEQIEMILAIYYEQKGTKKKKKQKGKK